MDPATITGFLATLCSVTSFVPQASKVIRARDMAGISGRMYGITVAGFALWLCYGLLLGQLPLIVTNAVCLLPSGFILAMKLLPRCKRDQVAATLDPAAPVTPPGGR